MELAPTDDNPQGQPGQDQSLVPGASQELATTDSAEAIEVNPVLRTWREMSWNRRIALMALVAMVAAIGVAMLLWAQAPEYKPLFIDLSENQAGEILEALDRLQADYRIDRRRGTILVPADQVHELRLRLAAQGLPRNDEQGFEILEKDPGFGVSRSLEKARFQRALEGELARSIMTLEGVKAARVHLALPKESVFVRQRKPPSASVLLQLAPGHEVTHAQVKAVVHLVAAAVPRLDPKRVTVVDQYGHLLNDKDLNPDELSLTDKQFEYKKKVETYLLERIETLLTPLVGRDALRAQVAADIDFTRVERTEELYNPDLPALRSEQQEEKQERYDAVQGVPGALTNQPPAAGTAPEVAKGGDGKTEEHPLEVQKKLIRNYELDRTVSHVQQPTGEIRRITVAVAVDNLHLVQPDGSVVSRPYTQEELNNLTALVKQAVGFDASRGDRVTVTNVAFHGDNEIAMTPLPLWQQPWVWTAAKYLLALLVVLILVFAVLRPLMKALFPPPPEPEAVEEDETGEGESGEGAENEEPLSLEEQSEELLMLEGPQSYEKRLAFVRRLIEEDPDRVVQVIKNWVAEDAAN